VNSEAQDAVLTVNALRDGRHKGTALVLLFVETMPLLVLRNVNLEVQDVIPTVNVNMVGILTTVLIAILYVVTVI